jgi:hypothetical protein
MPSFPTDRFRVTFMGANGTVGSNIGWIELLNGGTPRGYIYFLNIPDTQALPPDHLSSDGSYIVMSQRTKYLDAFLTVLKGPKPLTISFDNGLALLIGPDTVNLAAKEPVDTKGLEIAQKLTARLR